MRGDQVRQRAPAMTPEPDVPARTKRADPVTVLRRRFPGLACWYGLRTRSWWAMVRVSQGWRLVEAMDADELTRAILTAATWPYPVALTSKRSRQFALSFDEKAGAVVGIDKQREKA